MKSAVIRGVIVGIGILAQVIMSVWLYMFLIDKLWMFHLIFSFLEIVIIVGVIKYSKNYSSTLPLIIILLFFPLVGTVLYIVIHQNKNNSKILKRMIESEENSKKYLVQKGKIKEEIKEKSSLRYISDFAGFPFTKGNDVIYYPLGEIAFQEMVEDLKKAKNYIFLEYFIIDQGVMWETILKILQEKIQQGVEVRVIYDDAGCIATLEKNYDQKLEKMGIKCIAFNKLDPISGVIMNHRDHRKILIIDGKIAFSGGINIADEYINVKSPYGHWKDNGIKIEGEAVWSYIVMFLTMWNALRKEDGDYNKYRYKFKKLSKQEGLIAPYAETPLDEEQVGEDIYLNIINQAHNYIYIFTPYLIIDTDMMNALILAAKRGVDVRIIIPGIPDKKIVYTLSESYLELLIKGGVKIYKYTPGFVHSKVFVADDRIATVGTINLDYRSLYLHFECGLYLENARCIRDIKEDALKTMKKSHLVTKEEATPRFFKSVWQGVLRLFAPLL